MNDWQTPDVVPVLQGQTHRRRFDHGGPYTCTVKRGVRGAQQQQPEQQERQQRVSGGSVHIFPEASLPEMPAGDCWQAEVKNGGVCSWPRRRCAGRAHNNGRAPWVNTLAPGACAGRDAFSPRAHR
jgi:hypothetical protein